MIPFIHVPDAHLGPLTLHPFGAMVAIAVTVGVSLAHRRAKRLGLDDAKLGSFIAWVVFPGFIGGHVIDALLYHPAESVAHPARLLEIWNGQGSFGGFIGAVLGALFWKFYRLVPRASWFGLPRIEARPQPESIAVFADLLLSVFPIAWMFGRSGCALAHDHPGVRAAHDSLFAVGYGAFDADHVTRFPLGIQLSYGDSPRYDLGTLELCFTVLLSVVMVIAWRRARPTGWYVGVVTMAYAPVRLALDFLRLDDGHGGDVRYAGLTPAQWSCMALFLFGPFVFWRRKTSEVRQQATTPLIAGAD